MGVWEFSGIFLSSFFTKPLRKGDVFPSPFLSGFSLPGSGLSLLFFCLCFKKYD